jgi:hypothetical protein
MRPEAVLPLGRKSSYGLLSHLKIQYPRPGSNPRTLGPTARTLATKPPMRTTYNISCKTYVILLFCVYNRNRIEGGVTVFLLLINYVIHIPFEKLIVAQQVQTFPAFCGKQMFFTVHKQFLLDPV